MLTFDNTLASYEAYCAALDYQINNQTLCQYSYEMESADGLQMGCHVGGTLLYFGLEPTKHESYETLFGIPATVASLLDAIHERLPHEQTYTLMSDLRAAIKPLQNLEHVFRKFVAWAMGDPAIRPLPDGYINARNAFQQAYDVYSTYAETGRLDKDMFLLAQQDVFIALREIINTKDGRCDDLCMSVLHRLDSAYHWLGCFVDKPRIFGYSATHSNIWHSMVYSANAYHEHDAFWSDAHEQLIALIASAPQYVVTSEPPESELGCTNCAACAIGSVCYCGKC